jgi:predicted enzyme related to lactoylglutathione lyase
VQRVVGIGGVFFRGRHPESLLRWYAEHLGMELESFGGDLRRHRGTVWAIFPAGTEYFGPSEQASMFNYRVSDLDAMLAQLREGGVPVDGRIEESEYGRFGWATDPEGNRTRPGRARSA